MKENASFPAKSIFYHLYSKIIQLWSRLCSADFIHWLEEFPVMLKQNAQLIFYYRTVKLSTIIVAVQLWSCRRM